MVTVFELSCTGIPDEFNACYQGTTRLQVTGFSPRLAKMKKSLCFLLLCSSNLTKTKGSGREQIRSFTYRSRPSLNQIVVQDELLRQTSKPESQMSKKQNSLPRFQSGIFDTSPRLSLFPFSFRKIFKRKIYNPTYFSF